MSQVVQTSSTTADSPQGNTAAISVTPFNETSFTKSFGEHGFITMIYGKPEDVKRSFDFVHCTPHFHLGTMQLFISERQYRACKDKKLIVNNPDNVKPWREDKFKSRGYTKE